MWPAASSSRLRISKGASPRLAWKPAALGRTTHTLREQVRRLISPSVLIRLGHPLSSRPWTESGCPLSTSR